MQNHAVRHGIQMEELPIIDGKLDGIPIEELAKQIIIVENFIPDAVCDRVVSAFPMDKLVDHKVMGGIPGGRTEKNIRDTKSVDISAMRMSINAIMRRIADEVATQVDPKALVYPTGTQKVEIEAWEHPQVLYYETGGHYRAHVDATDITNEDGTFQRGEVVRDVSILAYLNEDFRGGEIDFPQLGVRVKPKKGMAVAFPSNYRYRHAALPVTAGHRFALVCWLKAKGTPWGNSRSIQNAIRRETIQPMRW